MAMEDLFSLLKLTYWIYLVISAFFSFLTAWVVGWSQDARNERLFKKVFKETSDSGLVKNFRYDKPPGIIYYTHTTQSLFRRELKKLYYKIKKINADRCIIPYDNAEEMTYKIIIDAFSYLPGLNVVDRKFAQSLVYFLGYQYVLRNKNISPKVMEKFRNNFEISEYYEMIKCFGDKEYCDENIVLNPSSEMTKLRGLINEIILPIMRFSSRRLAEEKEDISEWEKKKESLMELFKGLYNGIYFVLYVGRLSTQKYIMLLKGKINENARGFILGASSHYYSKLSTIITFINPILVEKWGEKWMNIDDEEGFDEGKGVGYHYIILRRLKMAESNRKIEFE